MEMSKGIKPLRITEEEQIEAIRLYENGMSKLDLAKKFKLSKPTVNKVLADAGVTFRLGNQEKSKIEDLSGNIFGRLIVLRKSGKNKYHRVIYECQCSCGKLHNVERAGLINGTTKSCGCLNQELRKSRIKHGKSHDPEAKMLYGARARSIELGIECNLDITDIIIPDICPILGIPLFKSKTGFQSNNSPTLDRINPKLGYIKGNVKVISSKANRMKDSSTIEDLEKIIKYIKENSITNEKS